MEILDIIWTFFQRDIVLDSYTFKLCYFFYFYILIKLLKILLEGTRS